MRKSLKQRLINFITQKCKISGWGKAMINMYRKYMFFTISLNLGVLIYLEKEMATHSSILAWRIPWAEEPRGLQSTGSQRVGHDWATTLYTLYTYHVLIPINIYWDSFNSQEVGAMLSFDCWFWVCCCPRAFSSCGTRAHCNGFSFVEHTL